MSKKRKRLIGIAVFTIVAVVGYYIVTYYVPRNRAISLTKSYHIGSITSVEDSIYYALRKKGGDITVLGWNARKVGYKKWLVKFTWEENGKTVGFFYEANLAADWVRSVNSNPELSKKYGLKD